MKKIILLLFAVLATAINASAASFTAENDGTTIYYDIIGETTNVKVVAPTSGKYSGSVTIPSSVTYNETTYNVTSIGNEAFMRCNGLTSVTIPNSVTSIGNYAFANCSGLTSVEIPNSVTEIGMEAFVNCDGLTSVTIQGSVTSIGNAVFARCTSIQSFTGTYASSDSRCLIKDNVLIAFAPAGLTTYSIPNTVTSIGAFAFSSNTGLTSVTIPNSVTSIGEEAFSSCKGLTSVEIPASVTSLGTNAFLSCTNLTKITSLNTTPPTAQSNTFSYVLSTCKVIVPNATAREAYKSATGWSAFTNILSANQIIYYTSSDENVVTPIASAITDGSGGALSITSNTYADGQGMLILSGDITTIGDKDYKGAFQNCSALTSVTIPASVTSIGKYAFNGCSGLTSMEIPSSVTTIGNYAFKGCSALTSVTIPNLVTTIGEWAFQNCSGMTSVTIQDAVTSIGREAFKDCTSLSSVEMGNSVTEIGQEAFNGCSNLSSFTGKYASDDNHCLIKDNVLIAFAPAGQTSYSIPNGVTTIGESVFYNCTNLTSVTISSSVTTIGNYAFQSCTGLTSVTIPNSVTEIGRNVFTSCSGLAEVTSLATTAPTLGSDCFYNVATGLAIKVPGAAIGSYHTTWSDYNNKLQAISLALTDDAEYTYDFGFKSGTTTYTRKFTKTDWQGLFLPFAMNYDDWKDKGTMAELTDVNAEGVLLWTILGEGSSTEAGTPYIFKPNAAVETTFTVTGATLASCETMTDVTDDGYTLSGTYTTKSNMKSTEAYALSNGDFYLAKYDTQTLKPYRIYLTAPASGSVRIYSLIDGEGVATSIEEATADALPNSQQALSLQGVRVNSSYKGIVIENGKKVIRK